MVELIVEGYNIELDENTVIEITYSINDIRNPISTNNAWSKQIDLPGTDNNNDAFSFLFENNIEVGYNPNIKRDCEIRVDSIPIIEGYMRMDKVGNNNGKVYYKATIFGANTTIFEDMGDALLTELDLSEYDHLYTKDAVTNSWEQINRDGFYYPWINHNDKPWFYTAPTIIDSNGNTVIDTGFTWFSLFNSGENYQFYPGFYVKTLIDKMFEAYGYKYDSTFFNSDLFKSLFIPFNNTTSKAENVIRLTNQCYQIWSHEHVDTPYPHIQDSSVYYYSGLTEYDPGNLYYPYQAGWQPSIQTPSDGYWTFRVQGYNITGTGWQFSGGSFTIKSVLLDGTFPTELYRIDLKNPGSITSRYDFSFSFSIPDKILAGRRIIVQPYSKGTPNQDYKSGYVYNIDWDFDTPTPIIGGTNIKASETLPVGLKQSELFKTLILMFNLYVERDPNNIKNLTIEPYSNYYGRSSNTVDWTYKVDESSRDYALMSELNAGNYYFSYKKDTDYDNKNYTDKTQKIAGELTKYIQSNFISNQQKIELLPSPTIIQNLSDSDLLFWPSIHENISDANLQNTGYTGSISTKYNWRILAQNVITDIPYGITYNSITWGDFYTASHIPGYHGYPLTGTSLWFDWGDTSLCWDYTDMTGVTTLYQNYWEDYINLIKNQNSRLLTMDVFLTEREISNLRFYEKIFIDDCWWILNQLIYSPTSRKSKAELLLIPTSDALGLGYSNFALSDDVLYETQTITASLNIVNESLGNETYKFYIEVMSGSTVLQQFVLNGTAPRIKTITVTQNISILLKGNYVIRCRNEEGYQVDIPVTVYPMYEVTNIRYTPNPAYFTCNITISYDVVVTGDWTGVAKVGVQYIDETKFSTLTFSGPGTQTGSATFNNMGMGTKNFFIYDLLYYIQEHLEVTIVSRAPVQGDITAIDINSFILHWDSRAEADLGNQYQVSTDSNFNTIVKTGIVTPYTELAVFVSGLNGQTNYWTRIRGISYGTVYSAWSNVKTAQTLPTPAHLVGGSWSFVPANPSTIKQNDAITIKWNVINDGQTDTLSQQFIMRTFWDYAKLNLMKSGSTSQVIPAGGTVELSFTFNPLISDDIYAPTDVYTEVEAVGTGLKDTPVSEGYYPFYVQPCVDSASVTNIGSVTTPITGNTSQSISFRLNNLSCHSMPYGTYGVRVRYYSDNGSTSNTLHNLSVDTDIPSGSYKSYTDSFTLPNNWSNGTKKIGIEVSLNYGSYSELGSATFEYYQSVPSIHVESVDINVDTFGTVSASVTGHNIGSGSGNATPWFKITYPDNSVVTVTGTTYLITAGNTHQFDVAYSESTGNGTYSLVAGLYYGSENYGSGTDSCAEERWANIYLALLDNEAQLRWNGYTAGRSKTLSITFGLTGETSTYCDPNCSDPITGSASLSLEPAWDSVSAGSDCNLSFDGDYSTVTVTGIVLNGEAGNTSIHTISYTNWTPGYQCGDSNGYCKLLITHVDVTSGDYGVTQSANYFTKSNDFIDIGME